jgi:hypothetical protein
MIKEGADNFLSHFGNKLSYSSKAINIIVYNTNAGASDLGKVFDPSDSVFLKDLASSVKAQGNREKNSTDGMGGFSMGYKRVVVIGSSYFKPFNLNIPTVDADPVVATHELVHELQASITKGSGMRNPVWLCEGGAQVIGAAMSVYQGKDYWAIGGRNQWSNRIPANLTIADLKTMEGEDPKLREYTAGGALSEYLIAWGGFDNSLLVTQLAYQSQIPDEMLGFRLAFKIIYGQSLDDFYVHALPYINYVSVNWKSSYATSPEALAFISGRLGASKAAAEKAAIDKAAAEKAAIDKAVAELKAKQEAEAKVAADKVAADLKAKQEAEVKAAADKVAANKKITITCFKGKLTKKVTAVKPVCPAGYKKKA